MAWNGSGLFFLTLEKFLKTSMTVTTDDIEGETNQYCALFDSTQSTYNFDTDTAYAVGNWTGSEVSGAGYTAGGQIQTGTELTVTAGVLKYTAANRVWASSTIVDAEGCLHYFTGGDEPLLAVDFTAPYSTGNGTFTIQWNAGGIFTIDLVPAP